MMVRLYARGGWPLLATVQTPRVAPTLYHQPDDLNGWLTGDTGDTEHLLQRKAKRQLSHPPRM